MFVGLINRLDVGLKGADLERFRQRRGANPSDQRAAAQDVAAVRVPGDVAVGARRRNHFGHDNPHKHRHILPRDIAQL